MRVTLIGSGCGSLDTMTRQGYECCLQAEMILGPQRLLDMLPEEAAGKQLAQVRPQEIMALLEEQKPRQACVLLSGDSGFYSGGRVLLPLLEEKGYTVEMLPGVSSLSCFSAKILKPWQSWNLASAHGVDCDPVFELMKGKDTFFLTGGSLGPAELCKQISEAGLGELSVWIGENLTGTDERILSGTAEHLSGGAYAPLSVMLVEAAPVMERTPGGIPDEVFLRDRVPMTKRMVRSAILALLQPGQRDICWDIGSGTGSVSVELSRFCRHVYGLERKEGAYSLSLKNREKLMAWNLTLRQGHAPEDLEQFPNPDRVFIGGSGGCLGAIIGYVSNRAPDAKILVSAVTLETLHGALTAFEALGYETEVTRLSVTNTEQVAGMHMQRAENPVDLIMGYRR